MRDMINQPGSTRFIPSISGIPDDQARALERRHRLDRQQRSFQGPHRRTGRKLSLVSSPLAVMDEA